MKEKCMHQLKSVLCLLLIICCTITTSACSLSDITKYFSDFDARAYTESFLDLIAKNDYADYAEITDSTEDEAEQVYESLLDNSVNSLLSTITVSDDTKQQIREMFKSIYSKWSYEVGEATKNSDKSFTVPVTVHQLVAFKGALAETTSRFQKRVDNSESLSDDSYYDLYYQTFIEIVNETVSKAEYSTDTTVSVKISPTSSDSNVYEISSDSSSELFRAAMDLDTLESEASSITAAD
jgi:hypothetical protein